MVNLWPLPKRLKRMNLPKIPCDNYTILYVCLLQYLDHFISYFLRPNWVGLSCIVFLNIAGQSFLLLDHEKSLHAHQPSPSGHNPK